MWEAVLAGGCVHPECKQTVEARYLQTEGREMREKGRGGRTAGVGEGAAGWSRCARKRGGERCRMSVDALWSLLGCGELSQKARPTRLAMRLVCCDMLTAWMWPKSALWPSISAYLRRRAPG